MENNKITNILVVGIGGQGVMTATEILAKSAIELGHDAKKTEVAGMAQRGGVVSSHLRFGNKVLSPQIAVGDADILLAFEAAEGLRWKHMLKANGVALLNTTNYRRRWWNLVCLNIQTIQSPKSKTLESKPSPLMQPASPKKSAISN